MQTLLHRFGSVPVLRSMARRTHTSVGLLLLFLYGFCLQPADFAVLVLLFLTTALVESIATQGLAPRLLAQREKEPSFAAERHTLLGSACLQSLAVAAILFGAMALLARPIADLLFASTQAAALLQLAALAGFLRTFQKVPRQLLQTGRGSRAHAALHLGESLLTALLNLYVLVWADLGVSGVLWAEVVRESLVTLLLGILLRRDLMQLRASRRAVPRLWRHGPLGVWRELPALLLASNDRYVLALFASLPQLGLYAFACRLAQSLVDLAVQPLLNMLPSLRRETQDSGGETTAVLGRFVTYFVALSGLLALGLTVFTEPVLRLVAPRFTSTAAILPLLLLALLLGGVQRLLLANLALEGKSPRRGRLLLAAAAAASVVGNVLLVPRLGIWGAAVTTILAHAFLFLATLLVQRRAGGIRFEAGRLVKVAAALCSTVYIARFVTPEPLLGQFAAAAAMVFLYPALLGVLGFYTVAEIDRMRDVLNRRVVLLPDRDAASQDSIRRPAAADPRETGSADAARRALASRPSH